MLLPYFLQNVSLVKKIPLSKTSLIQQIPLFRQINCNFVNDLRLINLLFQMGSLRQEISVRSINIYSLPLLNNLCIKWWYQSERDHFFLIKISRTSSVLNIIFTYSIQKPDLEVRIWLIQANLAACIRTLKLCNPKPPLTIGSVKVS